MKTSLFVLPFLALLVGIIGSALGSAFPELSLATPLSWASAGAIIALWVSLDFQNFKNFFTRKGTRFGVGTGVVFIIGVAIFVSIAILTSKPRFNKSIDLTKTGTNSLSQQSFKIIENLNEVGSKPKVIAFFKDDNVRSTFKTFLSLYERNGAKFDVEFVNTQQNPTRAMAEKLVSANTVIFRLNNQEERITTFTEEKITNAIVKIMKENSKKIYFTKGHGEGQVRGTDASGYDIVVRQLENNKYEIHEISLIEAGKIPDDADLLVIAGPQYDFKPEEALLVEQHIQRGGALLVMVDALVQIPNLNAMLEKYGIKYNSDLLLLNPEDPRALLYGQNNAIITEFDDFNPVTKDFARQSSVEFLFPNTRSITGPGEGSQNDMTITMAGKSSSYTVRVTGVESSADLKDISQDRIQSGEPYNVIAVGKGKAKEKEVADSSMGDDDKTAEESTPKLDAGSKDSEQTASREARLVAVGTSQFATNQGAQSGANRDLFTNMANYLLLDEDFISIRPKDVTSGELNLNTGISQFFLLFISGVYPFLFLGTGVVYWLRRKSA